jgi:AsmA protein
MKLVQRIALGLVLFVLVLGGAAAAVLALIDFDALIARTKGPALAAVSKAVGRELTVDGVEVRWWPVLGVQARDLRLAESSSVASPHPFVEAASLTVGVELWPALRSFGQDLRVEQIVLGQPVVHVIRRSDGRFNFEDLGPPADSASPASEPMDPGARDYLESARVARVAIEGGRVVFEDRSRDGSPIEVKRIDVEATDLQLGEALRVRASMAVLADESNLELELHTDRLASRLSGLEVPLVTMVRISTPGLDLAPLDDLVPMLDLGAARLTADVTARIGKAIKVDGPVDVQGLRWGPDGELFDLGLTPQLAVALDLEKLRLLPSSDLRLNGAPLKAEGELEIEPLTWSNVAVRSKLPIDLEALRPLVPGVPRGKLAVDFTSEGTPDAFACGGRLTMTELQLERPGSRASGSAVCQGTVRGSAEQLDFDTELVATELAVKGDGFDKRAGIRARGVAKGRWTPGSVKVSRAEIQAGPATLTGAAFIPLSGGRLSATVRGENVVPVAVGRDFRFALPSVPADLKVSFDGRYEAPMEDPSRGSIRVERIEATAKTSDVLGTGRVGRLDPLQAEFDLRSRRLDLDALFPPSPATSRTSSGPVLPESLHDARVDVKARVTSLTTQGTNLRNVDLEARLAQGALTMRQLDFDAYGGRVDADGTRVELARDPLRYDVKARLRGVQAASLLDRWTKLGSTLQGDLNSQIDVAGSGLGWEQMVQSVAGSLSLELLGGSFSGLNVVQSTVEPLQKALAVAAPGRVDLGRKLTTDFRRLAGRFELKNGALRLPEQMSLQTSAGTVHLGGRIGLDYDLDLDGAIDLTPDLIRRMTGGRVKPSQAVPLNFGLGCTLRRPCVQGLDVSRTVAQLTKNAAERAVKDATKRVEDKVSEEAKREIDKAKEAAKKKLKKGLGDLF